MPIACAAFVFYFHITDYSIFISINIYKIILCNIMAPKNVNQESWYYFKIPGFSPTYFTYFRHAPSSMTLFLMKIFIQTPDLNSIHIAVKPTSQMTIRFKLTVNRNKSNEKKLYSHTRSLSHGNQQTDDQRFKYSQEVNKIREVWLSIAAFFV